MRRHKLRVLFTIIYELTRKIASGRAVLEVASGYEYFVKIDVKTLQFYGH